MDPVIERIIASPVWHVLYPFRENDCCYVVDGETWKRICPDQRWSMDNVPQVAYIQSLFEAMGMDVYAEDGALKPYRCIDNLVLYTPDRDKVEALAEKLKKTIVMHRLEGNKHEGYTHREAYRVGRVKP